MAKQDSSWSIDRRRLLVSAVALPAATVVPIGKPAPLPRVRVTEVPKLGISTVRRAVLMTDKVEGCPQIKVPAQVVLYEARAGSAGADHVAYEVTSENGEVATYDVAITVKRGEAPAPNTPRTPL